MDRITNLSAGGLPLIPTDALTQQEDGYTGKAADRLAAYEDLYTSLLQERDKIEERLALLRAEGKQSTIQFKQMIAQKLTNNNILMLYRARNL